MRMCLPIASLCLLAACAQLPAFAAGRGKAALDMQQGRGTLATSAVRPFVAPAEARAEMAKYSLKWHIPFEGCVKGLERVYGIAQDKPKYDLACFNCTDVALSVGLACGVPVPAAGFPDLSIVGLIRIRFKDWEGTIDLSAFDGMYSSPIGLLMNLEELNELYGENE